MTPWLQRPPPHTDEVDVIGTVAPVFTRVEAVAISFVSFLAAAIIVAYAGDAIGLTVHPAATLVLALGAAAAVALLLRPYATEGGANAIAFCAIVGGVVSWLLRLAWPHLLPAGSGPDLTHHLSLIDYIERTHRLIHDPALSAYLGEMIDYTPGSHLLVVLAGRWMDSDGLHAAHPVIAVSVALKAGLLFLVAVRCLPNERARTPLAVAAVLLLFLPIAYFVGSFTQHWFLAQVVSELFAVAMWWAIVAWDQQPSTATASLVALAGTAAFLTWPVWVGPLTITFVVIVVLHRSTPAAVRARHLSIALAPIAIAAVVHAMGRPGAAAIAGTSGFAIMPTAATMGWPFMVIGLAGTFIAAFDRRSRGVALLACAIGLQAAALFVLAKANRADTPYLSLKMFYLAIYPLAVAGAVGVRWALSRAGRTSTPAPLAWTLVLALGVVVARELVAMPRPTPIVSDPLYDAGRWARAYLSPSCVDYLVADDDTAYWLHLAVLGNARAAKRSLNNDTFEPKEALVRWILPGGLPYAIAGNVDELPRDIRANVDVLARFGPAAVVKRRGASTCPP
jgi:hypothetical protein